MDYQTLFELGELTPRQLRAWMDVDPTNAARALRQRPQLMEGLRDILSEESTAPEANRPVSAYDKIGDMREDIFGVDSDDGLLTRAAKGLGDAVVSPLALGAAGGDYLKAGFNELTGNEEGLQFEDTPGASDLIGDIINTGLAAATGGGGNVLKAGFGNFAKNGLKNTLGKAKGKVLGSSTGKMLLGGPKRRLATGIGAASLLGGPEEDAGEGVVDDIINTAPKAPKESISSADLDAPITNPVTGRQSPVSLDTPSANTQAAAPMQQAPDLSNPAGLAAMANGLGNFRPTNPKDKSPGAFQRQGIQSDLLAQAGRKVRQDIANQRREDNISDLANSMDQQIREAWLRSPSNKAGVPFEQLSPADQMKMRENYMASRRAGSYNSADEAAEIRNRKMLNELDRSGGYAVNYRDPENKRNLPGQISTKDAQNRIIQKPYRPGIKSSPAQEKTIDNPSELPIPTEEEYRAAPGIGETGNYEEYVNSLKNYRDNKSSAVSSSPAPTSEVKQSFPTLDVPAPDQSSVAAETPEMESSASSDSESSMNWEDLLYLAPLALTKGKFKPKNLRLPNFTKNLRLPNFTKIKKPQGIPLRQKRLGNTGQLENNRPYQLENKPLRLENNRPYQLDNRVATPEQVRKMQTGMGSGERAANKHTLDRLHSPYKQPDSYHDLSSRNRSLRKMDRRLRDKASIPDPTIDQNALRHGVDMDMLDDMAAQGFLTKGLF